MTTEAREQEQKSQHDHQSKQSETSSAKKRALKIQRRRLKNQQARAKGKDKERAGRPLKKTFKFTSFYYEQNPDIGVTTQDVIQSQLVKKERRKMRQQTS